MFCVFAHSVTSWTWLETGKTLGQDDYNNFIFPVGQQDCAIMNSRGNWTDLSCNLGRGYACKVSGTHSPSEHSGVAWGIPV